MTMPLGTATLVSAAIVAPEQSAPTMPSTSSAVISRSADATAAEASTQVESARTEPTDIPPISCPLSVTSAMASSAPSAMPGARDSAGPVKPSITPSVTPLPWASAWAAPARVIVAAEAKRIFFMFLSPKLDKFFLMTRKNSDRPELREGVSVTKPSNGPWDFQIRCRREDRPPNTASSGEWPVRPCARSGCRRPEQPQPGHAAIRVDVETHMCDRAEARKLLAEGVLGIGAQFLLRQEFLPEHRIRDQRIGQPVAETAHVGGLDRGAVGIVALEMRRVDDGLLDLAARAERDDHPVITRFPPPPGFPAIAHVDPAPGREQAHVVAVMGVREAEDAAAVQRRGKVDLTLGIGTVQFRHAIDPEARDAAVGIDADAQMRPALEVLAGMVVMRRGAERLVAQDFDPCLVGRRLVACEGAGLDPSGGRVVAGEMGRVDVEADDPSRTSELDDRTVMPAVAPSLGFPAVHPLAVVVELALDEDRVVILQHPVERREELVRGPDRPRAEAGGGKVDARPGKKRNVRVQAFDTCHVSRVRSGRTARGIREIPEARGVQHMPLNAADAPPIRGFAARWQEGGRATPCRALAKWWKWRRQDRNGTGRRRARAGARHGRDNSLALGGIRRPLAACHHRHRVDRIEFLFHRARSGPEPQHPRPRRRRGMAGPWRRLLPHPEIHGRARGDARAPDMVQMGKLCHMAVGCGASDPALLGGGGALPDRLVGDGACAMAGDRDLGPVADARLGRLR